MNSEVQKVDYSGRTVDLLLLKTVLDVPVAKKRVEIDVSNVSGEPMIVSGIEKLVQRFAIAFINAAGSTMFAERHGTDIIPSVANGLVYNMATLEAAAAEANMLAERQIKAADKDMESPADERLSASEVVDLEFSRERSYAMISIRLTSEAGSSYVYIIPVAVGVH